MDISLLQTLSLLLCFLLPLFLLLATAKKQRNSSTGTRLPPGPPRLPVFGNIFHVGNNLHCSLTDFSRIYGPIMSLKLGSLTTVIISSPEAAKEALKTHDHALSARIFNDPVRVFDHHQNSVVWLPSSTRWRFLRRITMTHLMSAQRLDANKSLQMSKTQELYRFISKCCERGEAIDMAHASFVTVLNIISSAMFSIDLATYDSRSSHEFQDTVVRLTKAVGKPNVGDFFPFLRFLDLQGTRKEAALCVGRMFRVFQNIIDVRIAKRSSQKEHREDDMLDSLLDLTQENEEEFTINDIKHLLSRKSCKNLTPMAIISSMSISFVTGFIFCGHGHEFQYHRVGDGRVAM
ncbi:Cytochrome P450 76C3 [Cardamine amara subsp. amara]|uniref:Cytochrome P450 76C3 n=1 Tax=Cardamine amara subsp. amara TaxID=228776 RepID=A0ABD0ZKP3_CARAN